MSGDPPLAELLALLEGADVPHMVVGSFASTYHGSPRSTRDIDVVVILTERSLQELLQRIDRDRYYVADEGARAALDPADQFNVVDLRTAWKIDLIVRKDRPFSHEEFSRRQPAVIEGVRVWISSPEDTVLSKLEWAARGGSDRQIADAASVLAVVGDDIDNVYLDRWASELGVRGLLTEARRASRG